jgi:hypothetical protein
MSQQRPNPIHFKKIYLSYYLIIVRLLHFNVSKWTTTHSKGENGKMPMTMPDFTFLVSLVNSTTREFNHR